MKTCIAVTSIFGKLRFLAMIFIICGVIYPAVIYGIGQLLFPGRTSGGLIEQGGKIVGAELIGQFNDKPQYFWPRPGMGTTPYDPLTAAASHYPYPSALYADAVKARVEAIQKAHPDYHGPIPVDMVTASASGLDPHISVQSARLQAGRVAKNRGITPEAVLALIEQHTTGALLGIFGTQHVNVLQLNLALDKEKPYGK